MKKLFALFAISVGCFYFIGVSSSAASIVARVQLSTQTMTVTQNGRVIHRWPVSTARKGKITPTGTWTAKYLKRHHYSSRYDNAPMPYSIFYSGNFAIHGTNAVSRLGSPASAGCIRLSTNNASRLFSMVQKAGAKNMKVVVVR